MKVTSKVNNNTCHSNYTHHLDHNYAKVEGEADTISGTEPRYFWRNSRGVDLVALLHARRCIERNELIFGGNLTFENNPTYNMVRALLLNCPVKQCRAMKEILNHSLKCKLGEKCTQDNCAKSIQLLNHWDNCEVTGCETCKYVRQESQEAAQWENALTPSSRFKLLEAAFQSIQTPRPRGSM